MVVDPRRTKTAEVADEHVLHPARHRRAVPVRARAHAVRRRARRPRATRAVHERRRRRARARAGVRTRGRSRRCAASTPTRSGASRARWRPRRPRAVYGRIGTCTQEFGTLASWLVDVVNVLTGNLDREGGAMFTLPAAGSATSDRRPPGPGRGVKFGRRQSRVRGAPGGVRRAAGRVPDRGDRDRRATGRSARSSRCRATRCSARPTAPRLDRRVGVARLHGQRRHLPQRDDAPRRRDPARAAAAHEGPLRPRAVPARDPQRRELLAAARRPRSRARWRSGRS